MTVRQILERMCLGGRLVTEEKAVIRAIIEHLPVWLLDTAVPGAR